MEGKRETRKKVNTKKSIYGPLEEYIFFLSLLYTYHYNTFSACNVILYGFKIVFMIESCCLKLLKFTVDWIYIDNFYAKYLHQCLLSGMCTMYISCKYILVSPIWMNILRFFFALCVGYKCLIDKTCTLTQTIWILYTFEIARSKRKELTACKTLE